MSAFEKKVLEYLIKFLSVKKENVSELKFVNAIGYSQKKMEEIREILKDRNFKELELLKDDSDELDPDLILVYKVVLSDSRAYFLVFVDPFELYRPTYLESVVQL